LLDKPIAQLKTVSATLIGVLFQEAENQIFHSKVAEEVAFGLRLQKLPAAGKLRNAPRMRCNYAG
jgi:energy-coupling factor transport system ATP-binding protein